MLQYGDFDTKSTILIFWGTYGDARHGPDYFFGPIPKSGIGLPCGPNMPFRFFPMEYYFSNFDSGMQIYRRGERVGGSQLAVQKVVDSIKKMENGIIKIRYLLGCGVSKMKGGAICLIFDVCRILLLSIIYLTHNQITQDYYKFKGTPIDRF